MFTTSRVPYTNHCLVRGPARRILFFSPVHVTATVRRTHWPLRVTSAGRAFTAGLSRRAFRINARRVITRARGARSRRVRKPRGTARARRRPANWTGPETPLHACGRHGDIQIADDVRAPLMHFRASPPQPPAKTPFAARYVDDEFIGRLTILLPTDSFGIGRQRDPGRRLCVHEIVL